MVGACWAAMEGVPARDAEALEVLERADTHLIDETGRFATGRGRCLRSHAGRGGSRRSRHSGTGVARS